ncbi:molybdopterin oxidoreductase family protein [Streptomyces violaceorubidus]
MQNTGTHRTAAPGTATSTPTHCPYCACSAG